jgi:RNA polymerase sigma-70 factor, ECF subfamily
VTRALAALPSTERQVVELTYYEGLSYPEIAALMVCPVNTIKARMARARQRLAPQLDALGLAPVPE